MLALKSIDQTDISKKEIQHAVISHNFRGHEKCSTIYSFFINFVLISSGKAKFSKASCSLIFLLLYSLNITGWHIVRWENSPGPIEVHTRWLHLQGRVVFHWLRLLAEQAWPNDQGKVDFNPGRGGRQQRGSRRSRRRNVLHVIQRLAANIYQLRGEMLLIRISALYAFV